MNDFPQMPHIFSIPKEKVILPFPCTVNPLCAWLENQTTTWLLNSRFTKSNAKLLSIVKEARFHELAARVHPRADKNGLLLISNLISFLFFFDDLLDTSRSRIGTDPSLVSEVADLTFNAFRGMPYSIKAMGDLPLDSVYQERLSSLCALLCHTTSQLKSYANGTDHYLAAAREYLDAIVEETHLRGQGCYSPTVDEYVALRLRSSGVMPCLELGAIVHNCYVPDLLRSTEIFQAAQRACNLNCSYVNDLLSYPKELKTGEGFNLVMVLQRSAAGNVQAAFEDAWQTTLKTVEDYLKVRADLVDQGDGAVGYLQLMEDWMAGNLDWSLNASTRYSCSTTTHPDSQNG